MPVKIESLVISINLEIQSKEQADYLIATMQNNVLDVDPDCEDESVRLLRRELFEAARTYLNYRGNK